MNKLDSAPPEGVEAVISSIREVNPAARIVRAASPFDVDGLVDTIKGRRVLAVEDGPTVTHGEMPYGAAALAARRYGASALVDPRPFAVGSLVETFAAWPHVREVLPAMGYGRTQMEELRETIARSDADVVLIGTPIDLRRLIELDKPSMRVTYRLQELEGGATLADALAAAGVTGADTLVGGPAA